MKPFCFILMPVGVQQDDTGRRVDFDLVFRTIVEPAIQQAGMNPVTAEPGSGRGSHNKTMFERLMLCDFAVADLTTLHAGLTYDLGIRDGGRLHSTIFLFAQGTRPPLDAAQSRGLPYKLNDRGEPAAPEDDSQSLARKLKAWRTFKANTPLFQLLTGWPQFDIARLKTDRFRELVAYSPTVKQDLVLARSRGRSAVAAIEAEIDLADAAPAALVDILLSYRAVQAEEDMIRFVERLPPLLKSTVMVQEQLGFALNRCKRREEAEQVLKEVINEHGINSETNGLLGRVYKDSWEEARDAGQDRLAERYLKKAIDTYLAGFEADWRDAFPGINAVTLMEMTDPVDPRQASLIPVVRYAAERRLSGTKPDYWDRATLLELAVLGNQQTDARKHLASALAAVREPWEPKTTAQNLRLIQCARERRDEKAAWVAEIAEKLSSSL